MGDFDISQIKNENEQSLPKTSRNYSSILKKFLIFLTFLGILLSAILIYSYKYRNRPDDITIGYSDKEGIALVNISDHLGYFTDNGIKIQYRNYDDEIDLIQALSESKIDVAFVEDISLTMVDFDGSAIKIISSVLEAEKYFFVVDTKKGIFDVSSLNGQDLGVSDSYKTDYWLENGLSNSGVNKGDINLKTYKPGKLAEELANAEVAGVFTWQPYVYESKTFEGSEVQQIVLPVQKEEGVYTYLISSQNYINSNYSDLKKLLMSLISSEGYIEQNSDVSIEFLTGEWATDKNYVSDIFGTYNYKVNITRESKDSLEKRYEWSSRKSSTNNEQSNIESLYYYNLLREIDPKRAEF
ncbi:ABC transporter substrate-binding protein [Candidatus Dojkabacteria bacterium]|uniref:ABC transporter substrate-binding protein n=1 Tax=Candidatus Dojkabacteria bacterium TaxID=2099670 RepID=A0A955I9I0_9BACT|nr:ABC transporter substrate-binding protein [Candidatus Dojkabacteria bacterium]